MALVQGFGWVMLYGAGAASIIAVLSALAFRQRRA